MSWLPADLLERAVARCADNEEVRHAFLGVFPHNRLPTITVAPEKLRLPLTLIVNTDTHN